MTGERQPFGAHKLVTCKGQGEAAVSTEPLMGLL
jgi:hypothetical protein